MRKLDVKYLMDISLPVLIRFDQIEPRRWNQDVVTLELLVEIGSLGRALTIWENYRHGNKSRHQLGDELSDILFVIFKLAKDSKICLPSTLEIVEVSSPEKIFFRLTELALELKNNSWISLVVVKEVLSLVGGLATYYDLDIYKFHRSEMALTSNWQKVFFDVGGIKKKNFIFFRKTIWSFLVWCHEKTLNI